MLKLLATQLSCSTILVDNLMAYHGASVYTAAITSYNGRK